MEKYQPAEGGLEKKETSFNEGVEKAMHIIKQLLASKDYVVVGISGPHGDDVDVGKTTLSRTLAMSLRRDGIPVSLQDAFDHFGKYSVDGIKREQEQRDSQKSVIIFGAISFSLPKIFTPEQVEKFKQNQDSKILNIGKSFSLPLTGIDLRILIYRPNQKINNTGQIVDLYIKNELAKNKDQASKY